jgi:vacuolar-type H+-ATPase subunit I/STV1
MENSETKMSESESMQLITSMINKAKNLYGETGLFYLIWGWVILFCFLTEFINGLFFHNPKGNFVWLLIYVVLIFQIIYKRRTKKFQRTKTYTREINEFVWIAFFICLMLTIFTCVTLKRYELINPLLLIMYGMPTFLSGIIIKFKPLIIGGIFCWLMAVISPFIDVRYQVLLAAAAVIAAWIVPGHLLRNKYKMEMAGKNFEN